MLDPFYGCDIGYPFKILEWPGQIVAQWRNVTLCEANPHDKVPSSSLETSLSMLGTCLSIIQVWLKARVDHGIGTLLGMLCLCLSGS